MIEYQNEPYYELKIEIFKLVRYFARKWIGCTVTEVRENIEAMAQEVARQEGKPVNREAVDLFEKMLFVVWARHLATRNCRNYPYYPLI